MWLLCYLKLHQNLNFVLSYELHVYMACPLNLQPAVKACSPGPTEVKYTGKGQSANVSNLEPYTTYNLRVVSYNSVGSSASEWVGFTTEKEREYEKWFTDQWCLFLRPEAAQNQMNSPPLGEWMSPKTSSSMSLITASLLHIHWNSALGLNCSFLQKYFFAHHLMSHPLSWELGNLLLYWKWAAKLQNIKCLSITRRLICSNKYTAINNPLENWRSWKRPGDCFEEQSCCPNSCHTSARTHKSFPWMSSEWLDGCEHWSKNLLLFNHCRQCFKAMWWYAWKLNMQDLCLQAE